MIEKTCISLIGHEKNVPLKTRRTVISNKNIKNPKTEKRRKFQTNITFLESCIVPINSNKALLSSQNGLPSPKRKGRLRLKTSEKSRIILTKTFWFG